VKPTKPALAQTEVEEGSIPACTSLTYPDCVANAKSAQDYFRNSDNTPPILYPANSKKKGLSFSHVQLAAQEVRQGLGGLDDAQRGIATGLAQKLAESERLKK
jgi:hypothetical protein